MSLQVEWNFQSRPRVRRERSFYLRTGGFYPLYSYTPSENTLKVLKPAVNRIPGAGSTSHSVLLQVAVVLLVVAMNTAAQDSNQLYDLNIEVTDAVQALDQLADQTDCLLLFPYELARSRQANPVVGRFTIDHALQKLLDGSGLSGVLTNRRVISITAMDEPSLTKGDTHMLERKEDGVFRRTAAAVAAVLFATSGSGAIAADDQPRVLEEIVVTAEKRETNVQAIPVAITVLDAEEMDKQGIHDVESLQFAVVGLTVSSLRYIQRFSLRGIGEENTSSGGETSIAFHVDGVYQARQFAAGLPLYDMERVEVLRGPQGTLYGRNATGGAINYVTKKPIHEFEAYGDLLVGDYDRIMTRGAVNIPIVEDKAAFRFSWLTEDRDGYTDNTFLNRTIGDIDSKNYRGHLRLSLTPNLEIMISSLKETMGGNQPWEVALTDVGFGSLPIDPDPYKTSLDFVGAEDSDLTISYIKLTWNLGNVIFSSLTSNSITDVQSSLDADFTELNLINFEPLFVSSDLWSQEFQLQSNTEGPLEWNVGLYRLGEEIDDSGVLPGALTQLYAYALQIEVDSYAAYAQATYALNDQLNVTAGLRYTKDEKDTQDSQTIPPAFTGLDFDLFLPVDRDVLTWKETTWKLGVEYFIDDDRLLYASASRGYKAGGIWAQQADAYNPEYILAYEVGSKNRFNDDHLQVNAAAYFYDYEDMQLLRSGAGILNILDNAGQATIKGFEVDVHLLPTDALDIGGSISFTNAEFDRYDSLDVVRPELGIQNLSGNQLPRVPEWAFKLWAEYAIEVGGAGILTSRLDYYWRDETFYSAFNDVAQGLAESFGRVNALLKFESLDGRWHADAFVNNIGDNDDLYYRRPMGLLNTPTSGATTAPRTFGVRVGVRL